MGIDASGGVSERLKSDALFGAMLAAYLDAPAILTDPPPDDLEIKAAPTVIVSEPFHNEPDDTFTYDGRDVKLRVRIYSKHNGSSIAINAVAEAARKLLHNWSASSFPGGNLFAAQVSGPVAGPTSDPSIEGRILTVSLNIKET